LKIFVWIYNTHIRPQTHQIKQTISKKKSKSASIEGVTNERLRWGHYVHIPSEY